MHFFLLTYPAIIEHMDESVIIKEETYSFSSRLRHYKDVLMACSLVIPAAFEKVNYNFILKVKHSDFLPSRTIAGDTRAVYKVMEHAR